MYSDTVIDETLLKRLNEVIGESSEPLMTLLEEGADRNALIQEVRNLIRQYGWGLTIDEVVTEVAEDVRDSCDNVALFVNITPEMIAESFEKELRTRFCWVAILSDLGEDVAVPVSLFLEALSGFDVDEDYAPATATITETIRGDIADGVPGRWFH